MNLIKCVILIEDFLHVNGDSGMESNRKKGVLPR